MLIHFGWECQHIPHTFWMLVSHLFGPNLKSYRHSLSWPRDVSVFDCLIFEDWYQLIVKFKMLPTNVAKHIWVWIKKINLKLGTQKNRALIGQHRVLLTWRTNDLFVFCRPARLRFCYLSYLNFFFIQLRPKNDHLEMKIMPWLTSGLYCKMQFAGGILLPRCDALWGEFPIFCTNVIPGILFFSAQESWVTASTRKTCGQPWMTWVMTWQGDWETCEFAAKFSHFPPASFSMFFCKLPLAV